LTAVTDGASSFATAAKDRGITNTRDSKLFLNVSFVYVFYINLKQNSQYNPTIYFMARNKEN
jgi:hypothetical protein